MSPKVKNLGGAILACALVGRGGQGETYSLVGDLGRGEGGNVRGGGDKCLCLLVLKVYAREGERQKN